MGRAEKQLNTARLRSYLRQAGLRPGDRLPGERELAAALGLGRTALRPLLDELETEGVIDRRSHSGTFLTSIPAPAVRGEKVAVIAPLQGNNGASRETEAIWLHRVISAFERTAVPAGAQVLLKDQSSFVEDSCSIKNLAKEAVAEGASAVVLVHPAGSRQTIAHALILLHNQGVHPLILSARTYPGLASQVYFDSGWGTYHAARHLLLHGHTRIGFAGGPSGHEWVQERRQGYLLAQETAEVAPREDWTWLSEQSERMPETQDGAAAFQAWRALPPVDRPTAVIAANDVIALGFLEEAQKAGVRIPDDLSLIGFDNDPGALATGLTTIERPTEALGESAARVLLERLAEGTQAAAVTVRLRPVLIERRTVAAPPDTR